MLLRERPPTSPCNDLFMVGRGACPHYPIGTCKIKRTASLQHAGHLPYCCCFPAWLPGSVCQSPPRSKVPTSWWRACTLQSSLHRPPQINTIRKRGPLPAQKNQTEYHAPLPITWRAPRPAGSEASPTCSSASRRRSRRFTSDSSAIIRSCLGRAAGGGREGPGTAKLTREVRE